MPCRKRLEGIPAYLPWCRRAPGADTHEIKDEVLVVLGVRPGAAPGYPSKISWLSTRSGLVAILARSAIKRPMQLHWFGSVSKNREKGLNENRANRSQLSLERSHGLGCRLGMGLPFDRIDGNHSCPGPGVHKPKVHPDLRRYAEARPPHNCICRCGGCDDSPGNYSARDRNRLLGYCLPRHRRYARRQVCD